MRAAAKFRAKTRAKTSKSTDMTRRTTTFHGEYLFLSRLGVSRAFLCCDFCFLGLHVSTKRAANFLMAARASCGFSRDLVCIGEFQRSECRNACLFGPTFPYGERLAFVDEATDLALFAIVVVNKHHDVPQRARAAMIDATFRENATLTD
jgi:hypothetical protein